MSYVNEKRAIDLMVSWGNSVIYVGELSPPRSFFVGETAGASGCDCFLPSEVLGVERWPLVLLEEGQVSCVVHPNALGEFQHANEAPSGIDDLPDTAPWVEWPGARRIVLGHGSRVHLELGGVVFDVRYSHAEQRVGRTIGAVADKATAAYFGLSFGFHASILGALAFFTPALGLTAEEDLDQRRLYLMQQYLDASAEREKKQEEAPADAGPKEDEGGTGTRAVGEEGAMGTPTTSKKNGRYGIQGNAPPADQQLSRAAALDAAQTFGIISILAGDPNTPTAPWGRDVAIGSDAISARGNIWGASIDEAFGAGGLGLTGNGESGGGRGEGIGLGEIGGLGHGSGTGTSMGFGPGDGGFARGIGRTSGTHVATAPRVRPGVVSTSGRLPPEVIQRTVRQNFGRFRLCYQQGLTRNPNLQGRVSARFVIDRSGAVSSVSNGGSDLPDSAVTSCVISAFYGLSFPQPENGIVTVVYPIQFAPG